jgi:hypothetical protein
VGLPDLPKRLLQTSGKETSLLQGLLSQTESEGSVNDLFRYRDLLIGLKNNPLCPPDKLSWIEEELKKIERRLNYEVRDDKG